MNKLFKSMLIVLGICLIQPVVGQNLYLLRATAEQGHYFERDYPPVQLFRCDQTRNDSNLVVVKDFTKWVDQDPTGLKDVQYYPVMRAFYIADCSNDYYILYTETPDTLVKVPFQCPENYKIAPPLSPGFFVVNQKWGYQCFIVDRDKPDYFKFMDRSLKNTASGTPEDLKDIYLTGKTIMGDVRMPNDKHIYLPIVPDITKRPPFSVELPEKYMVTKKTFLAIIANDDKYTILLIDATNPEKGQDFGKYYATLYNKSTKKWHDIELGGNTPIKMVYGDWLAGHVRDGMDFDAHYFPDPKKSPGRALRDSAKLGYQYVYYSINTKVYTPGILYLLNLNTLKYIEWETNQGDSEILLVENETVYYRVFDQIYKVKIINGEKIGNPVLLAKDTQVVPFIHWAFLSEK
jgi:hypothetical protein